MKLLLPGFSLTFLFLANAVLAQNTCGCTACSKPIPNNFQGDFKIRILSADSNALASPTQGLCGVKLSFAHDRVGELQLELISPAGQKIRLVSPSGIADTTKQSAWNIRFNDCAEIASPDAGHSPNWGDNHNWGPYHQFSGTYHPADGCLTNFDVGPVVGDWVLRIHEMGGTPNAGYLFGFGLEFCEMSGVSCLADPPPPPPSEECAQAPIFENLNGYLGNTGNFNANPGNQQFCGILDADQWLGFVAGAPNMAFIIQAGNCLAGNGVQAAIYEDCAAPPLVCDAGQPSGAILPIVLSATNLTPGEDYFLVVDAFAGDACDFQIQVLPPVFGALTQPPVPQGVASVCNGGEAVYEIPPSFGANGYLWEILGNGQFPGQSQIWKTLSPTPEPVTVFWGAGGGQICVAAYNTTDTSAFSCLDVLTLPEAQISFSAVYLCQDALPFQPPFQHPPVTEAGTYTFTKPGINSCDTIFSISVFVSNEPQDVFFPPTILINDQCFYLPDGQKFCDPGEFEIEKIGNFDCPTMYHFDITKITFGSFAFACAPVSVPFLANGPDTSSLFWAFPGGNPNFSNGGSPEVLFENEGSFGFIVQLGSTTVQQENVFKIGELPNADFSINQQNNTFVFNDLSTGTIANYAWDFGDGTPITNGPNQIHDFGQPGVFDVTLVVSNACGSDTATAQVTWGIPATGENELENAVKIYPNPTFETFTVELAGNVEKPGEAILTTGLGQRVGRAVFSKVGKVWRTGFEVSNLPAGIYFLKIPGRGIEIQRPILKM